MAMRRKGRVWAGWLLGAALGSVAVLPLCDLHFDCVITVCGHADATCPALPRTTLKLHQGFDDPPKLAASASSHAEALVHYRRVRDEIKAFLERLTRQTEL